MLFENKKEVTSERNSNQHDGTLNEINTEHSELTAVTENKLVPQLTQQNTPSIQADTLSQTDIFWGGIFGFLSIKDLALFSRVSRTQTKLINDAKEWRDRIKTDFQQEVPAENRNFLFSWLIIYCTYQAHSKLIAQMLHKASKPGDSYNLLPSQHDAVIPQMRLANYPISYDVAIFQKRLEGRFNNNHLLMAARVGNIELVKWLTSEERGTKRLTAGQNILDAAAESGNEALVEYLLSPPINFGQLASTIKTLDAAVKSGSQTLVKWLTSRKRGCNRLFPKLSTLKTAARSGNQPILKYLLALNPLFDKQITIAAARSGNQNLVEWLLSINYVFHNPNFKILFDEDPADNATVNFQMPVVKGVLHAAAKSGNQDLVEWLVSPDRGDKQLTADLKTLHQAAESGNQALVEWLVSPDREDKQLILDQPTLYSAIRSGNQALVEWLTSPDRNIQLIIDKVALNIAAGFGKQALVEWILSPNRANQDLIADEEIFIAAKNSGNRTLANWIANWIINWKNQQTEANEINPRPQEVEDPEARDLLPLAISPLPNRVVTPAETRSDSAIRFFPTPSTPNKRHAPSDDDYSTPRKVHKTILER